MRISDWSSDVCSSDLISGAGDLVNIRHGVHRALLSMPASGVRGCPGGGALRCRPCRSRLLTACCQQYRGSLPAVFPCCQHAVSSPAPAFLQDRTRSEEHTSAIQSLKRIPYAVFCWKKKTSQEHTHELH